MDQSEVILDKNTIYKIKISENLHQKWAQWLGSLLIEFRESRKETDIIINVPDQSALRGVLNKLWDLNLTIISMEKQDRT